MNKNDEAYKRKILRSLHLKIGICATCSKRKCHNHGMMTKLPDNIPSKVLLSILNSNALYFAPDEREERSDKIHDVEAGAIEHPNSYTTIHRSGR